MNALVYSCSNEYSYLAGISLLSCLEHNPSLKNMTVLILDNEISDENKQKLSQVCEEYSVPIQFINVTSKIEKLIQEGMVTGHHSSEGLSYATYGRLFIDKVIPAEIKRVVYIDCDTLIMGSIESLFTLDLEEKSVALACDLCRAEYRKVIGIPSNAKYYSAGIMVIDIGNWRKNECGIRIFRRIAEGKGKYPLVDQDLINVICKNEIFQLAPQYNFLSQCFLYDYDGLCKVYKLNEKNYYTRQEFNNARLSPIIFHFSGSTLCRPWYNNSKHPMKTEYDSYYYKSPWKDKIQTKCSLPIQYRIQAFLYRQPLAGLAVLLGKLMQRIFILLTYRI